MPDITTKAVTIYVAEEVEIYREAYKSMFTPESNYHLLGISDSKDLPALIHRISTLSPKVLLLGTRCLNEDIITELTRIRADIPHTGVVLLLLTYDADRLQQLRGLASRGQAGMAVFLRQSLERTDQLCGIINSVNEGHVILDPALAGLLFAEKMEHPYLKELTTRELEVLNLIASGYTNGSIAEALCIDIRTVQRHINNMYSKLTALGDYRGKHLRVSAARLYFETTGKLLATPVPQ